MNVACYIFGIQKFKETLKILQYTVILLFGGFMLFAAYKIYTKNVGLDLTKATKTVGQITKSYTTTRRTGGTGQRDIPVFAFNIDKVDQTLGVYRPTRDYSELMEKLKIGDTVTIYYKLLTSNIIDIDVYQIEKDGKIIVDYKSYSKNYSFTSIAIGVLGLLTSVFGIIKLRKT